jgi:hypothetical protein
VRGKNSGGGADSSPVAGVDHRGEVGVFARGCAKRETVRRGKGGDDDARPFLKWCGGMGRWWGWLHAAMRRKGVGTRQRTSSSKGGPGGQQWRATGGGERRSGSVAALAWWKQGRACVGSDVAAGGPLWVTSRCGSAREHNALFI